MESILIPKLAKNSLPTIKDLLNLPVFRRHPPNPQSYFKILHNVMEKLSIASNYTMDRLKLDNDKVIIFMMIRIVEYYCNLCDSIYYIIQHIILINYYFLT